MTEPWTAASDYVCDDQSCLICHGFDIDDGEQAFINAAFLSAMAGDMLEVEWRDEEFTMLEKARDWLGCNAGEIAAVALVVALVALFT